MLNILIIFNQEIVEKPENPQISVSQAYIFCNLFTIL